MKNSIRLIDWLIDWLIAGQIVRRNIYIMAEMPSHSRIMHPIQLFSLMCGMFSRHLKRGENSIWKYNLKKSLNGKFLFQKKYCAIGGMFAEHEPVASNGQSPS